MSLSKPEERAIRPAKRYVEFKGGEGKFQYYDRDLKENVVIPAEEMCFIVLDKDLFTVAGYSEKYGTGIYSNEAKELDTVLTVKVFDKAKTIIAKGKYADIKDTVRAVGGKYCKCIYLKPKGVNEIWHLKLSGGAFQNWITQVDAASHNTLTQYYVTVSGLEEGKKGGVTFKKPIFALEKKITKKDLEEAIALDADTLQPYLKEYLAMGKPYDEHIGGGTSPTNGGDVDTNSWQQCKVPGTGTLLCQLGIQSLRDIQAKLEDEEDVTGAYYQMVCRAIHEFQKASKNWKEKKTPKGKSFANLTLEDFRSLLSMIDKKNPAHELRMSVLAAIEALGEHMVDDIDDDNIPF